jgi:hypothetical protein
MDWRIGANPNQAGVQANSLTIRLIDPPRKKKEQKIDFDRLERSWSRGVWPVHPLIRR